MKYTTATLCLLLCFANTTSGQTYDLNVSCPVVTSCACCGPAYDVHAATVGTESSNHCSCDGHVTSETSTEMPRQATVAELLADQDQLLKDQFAKMVEAQDKLFAAMEEHQATNVIRIDDLKKSLRSELVQNRLTMQNMLKKAADREKAVIEKVDQSSEASKSLSRELISIAEKSIDNSKAIVDVIQASEKSLAKFQQQVRSNLKAIGRRANGSEAIVKKLEENSEQTHRMFEALEDDLEEIRQRISKIERDEAKHQKQIQSKLKLLEEIGELIDQVNKKKSKQPKRKRSK